MKKRKRKLARTEQLNKKRLSKSLRRKSRFDIKANNKALIFLNEGNGVLNFSQAKQKAIRLLTM